MRFQKRVNICKGVRLNLSGSGVSCTVGGKGLSLNLGKNGVFLNAGLPGTGLSSRKKLIDSKKGGLLGGLFGGKSSDKERDELDVRNYEVFMEEDGSIEILTRQGMPVSEEEERILRRTEWFEKQSDALMEQFREEIEAQTEAFVHLYRHAQKAAKAGAIEPAEDVEARLDDWLAGLELPMSFDAEYEYNEENGSVMMDLDLPEIEDIPDDKVVELASGALKAKDKTQKELKEDYRTCVLGLAVFMASHVFSASAGIENVLISGYTQRRDRKTGELEDCYIYSIAFERKDFQTGKCSAEDPADFCDRFRSRINVLASGEMKEIVPYTPEEFAEMIG